LPEGIIDISTRLVLTDAVYFHGDWLTPFKPGSQKGIFHADGGDVSVAMMSNQATVPVWSGSGWTAASIPYVGGTTSMLVLVPDIGGFASVESSLTAGTLASVIAGQAGAGAVVMPRFKFSTATPLKETLVKLGMPDAFGAAADFSGIDGATDLFISNVIHQANVEVDEKGTTAAAATAVIIAEKGAVPLGLLVDRPFMFFVRHNPTGAILFAGRVMDPTQ